MRQTYARRRCRIGRRAFASFSAVVLVGTTALALAALARVTVHDIRRANDAADDAQLRQLLLAGQAFVESQTIKTIETDRIDITLPSELELGSTLTVRYQRANADGPLTATIEATCHERSASVVLIDRESGQWRITEVRMP